MAAMIVLDHLAKRFGPLVAVDGISLSVAKGEVLGFLGPNGAGKSTTMKMLTGFLEPGPARARIAGHRRVPPPQARPSRQLGYLPEGAPLYGDMTLPRLPRLHCRHPRLRARRGPAAIDRVDRQGGAGKACWSRRSRRCPRASSAASASPRRILHDPEVLIMDEPTDGLDPNQKHQVRKLIGEMAADKAIIVSTHILEEVEAVCTRAIIINRGRIVADGTAEDLMRAPAAPQRHRSSAWRPAGSKPSERAAVLPAFAEVDTDQAAANGRRLVSCAHSARTGDAGDRHRARHRLSRARIDRGRGALRRARQARRRLPHP